MTPEQAAQRLIFHGQLEPGSFLDMLRPYRGLKHDVLDDLMNALKICAPQLTEEQLPRHLASALWAVSHLGRSWALSPDGMLRRNALINEEDQRKLGSFLDSFDYAVMTLLEGGDVEEAFSESRR